MRRARIFCNLDEYDIDNNLQVFAIITIKFQQVSDGDSDSDSDSTQTTMQGIEKREEGREIFRPLATVDTRTLEHVPT